MENTFYVFNRKDGTYIKYTRCTTTHVCMYIVGLGKESEALVHLIVEGGNKFSHIN